MENDEQPSAGGISMPQVAAEVIGEVADMQQRIGDHARALIELQSACLEELPDAAVVVDPETGRIILVNRRTEFLFGFARNALLGEQVEVLLPDRYRARHVTHRATFAEDPRPRQMGVELQLFGRHKSGREFAVEIMLSPIAISSGIYTIAIIRRKPTPSGLT